MFKTDTVCTHYINQFFNRSINQPRVETIQKKSYLFLILSHIDLIIKCWHQKVYISKEWHGQTTSSRTEAVSCQATQQPHIKAACPHSKAETAETAETETLFGLSISPGEWTARRLPIQCDLNQCRAWCEWGHHKVSAWCLCVEVVECINSCGYTHGRIRKPWAPWAHGPGRPVR